MNHHDPDGYVENSAGKDHYKARRRVEPLSQWDWDRAAHMYRDRTEDGLIARLWHRLHGTTVATLIVLYLGLAFFTHQAPFAVSQAHADETSSAALVSGSGLVEVELSCPAGWQQIEPVCTVKGLANGDSR